MEHISKLLNAKRLDVRKILSSPVEVSVKEDGTAFQIYNEKDTEGTVWTTFRKRPYKPDVPGMEICNIERFINYSYNEAVKYFADNSEYMDIIKEFKILNFEVISSEEPHIIETESILKIILLSAYDYDGKLIQKDMLSKTAKKLNIFLKKQLFFGRFDEKTVDFLMKNGSVFQSSTMYLDFLRNCEKTEGFVFSFDCGDRIRNYKLVNPEFKEKIDEHLKEESIYRQKYDCTYSYKLILDKSDLEEVYASASYIKEDLSVLCYWWMDLIYNKLSEQEKDSISSEVFNIPLIKKTKFNIDYVKNPIILNELLRASTVELDILKFMLYGFMCQRVKEPLWTDIVSQQTIINPVIAKLQAYKKV